MMVAEDVKGKTHRRCMTQVKIYTSIIFYNNVNSVSLPTKADCSGVSVLTLLKQYI